MLAAGSTMKAQVWNNRLCASVAALDEGQTGYRSSISLHKTSIHLIVESVCAGTPHGRLTPWQC